MMFPRPIERVRNFFEVEIWKLDPDSYGFFLGNGLKLFRILLIIINDFIRDKCMVLASSLTYYSILAIVPFFAVIFVVLKYMGLQNTYGVVFLNNILLNPEISKGVVEYVNNTELGALGIIGALALIKVAFLLLMKVEHHLNYIWGARENRPFFKKIAYYFIAIILLPVIITLGFSVAIEVVGDYIFLTLGMLPYLFTILGFTFLYSVLPNVPVKLLPALAGGTIAGLLWHAAQQTLVYWAARATEFNLIYGSFSQLVLVFMWVYISWTIILIGAEISFAVQNHKIYRQAKKSNEVSSYFRDKVALTVAASVFRKFSATKKPVPAQEVIESVGGSVKLVNNLLFDLTAFGFLQELRYKKSRFFIPASGAEDATVYSVIKAFRESGDSDIKINESDIVDKVNSALENIMGAEAVSGDVRLSEI